MKNEFEEMCAAQAHQQEIASSRKGCLGGSDAAMVLKVARNGIEALSNTDIKRLRVMLGLEEREDFGGSAATNAGHLFEDYVQVAVSEHARKEHRFDGMQFHNFKIIAHADYYEEDHQRVCECKFVQKPTEKVLAQYFGQLQWYYLFSGVDAVILMHGTGTAEPFSVDSLNVQHVDYNEVVCEDIMNGLRAIDNWCDWYLSQNTNEWRDEEFADEELMELLSSYGCVKSTIDLITSRLDELRKKIEAYMAEHRIASSRTYGVQVSYKQPTSQRRLDAAKAQAKYPQLATDEECWKTTKVKGSVTIKLVNDETDKD
jgi:hypothetical protein